MTDMMAYLFGSMLGRHKLAPSISLTSQLKGSYWNYFRKLIWPACIILLKIVM